MVVHIMLATLACSLWWIVGTKFFAIRFLSPILASKHIHISQGVKRVMETTHLFAIAALKDENDEFKATRRLLGG